MSQQTQTMSFRGSNTGITKQNTSSNMNPFLDNAPDIYERIIDMNDLVNLTTISEGMKDMTELDVMSIDDNNTQIISNGQLSKTPPCKGTKKTIIQVQPDNTSCTMTNKCKLALALLVGLVITVPIVSRIVWGVKSRDKEPIKGKPANNLTTVDFSECWDKSVNYSEHCNKSIVTELPIRKENQTTSVNISLLMRKRTGKPKKCISDYFVYMLNCD